MSGGVRIGAGSEPSAVSTVRRGLRLSPEFREGLALTLLLAVLATAGRTLVPLAVQRTIDRGLTAGAAGVKSAVLLSLAGVVLTTAAAYAMNVRLIRAAERGLSSLRVRTFAHVHDLSVLTQDSERRGSLVSRVTSDIDTLSTFLQSGGLVLLLSGAQLMVATAVMAAYSWELTLVVWVAFLPFFFFLRVARGALAEAYGRVRERVGDLLAVVSEAVLGASVIKAHAVEDRTARRIDDAVTAHYDALMGAQRWVGTSTATSDLAWGATNALLVLIGVRMGLAGELTLGELLAFLFLVTLFVSPVQAGVEMLNEAQNAVAGWRRVLAVLDTPAEVTDPADTPGAIALPPGRLDVVAENVRFAYPGGPEVLHDITVTLPAGIRVAVVGQTGSGKTTFAKLLVRLMDPTSGVVRLGGVDSSRVSFASLRRRTLLIAQEGFLFEGTLRDNLRIYLDGDVADGVYLAAIRSAGLQNWFEGLPAGLDTPVGQRGESLSVGERQLVALLGASLADPAVLVLDEATSAVDPGTESRLQTALAAVTGGRTAITIAHRLSTAEQADLVLVFDGGHLAERGTHVELVARGGSYAGLHAAWQVTAGRSRA